MNNPANPKNPCRLHAIIEGDVQGVGFRMFVKRKAEELKLKGWVRNLWDGSVEVIVEGDKRIITILLSSLKTGPRSSFVSNVRTEWMTSTDEFTSFQIRFSA